MAATIFIYDSIGGYGISARNFADTLSQLEAAGETEFILRINSPGGSVFDGFAIYNLLREKKVTVIVDGLAASIASVIALAGKVVQMQGTSMFMIHNPWMMAAGDVREFEKAGQTLDMVGKQIAQVYMDKTGADYDTVKAWMDAEKWFTAKEAKEAKFIDEVRAEFDEKNFVALYTQDDTTIDSQKTKGKAVNKLLLAFLGLAADATEEQVNAKLAELRSKLGLAADAPLEALIELAQNADNDANAISALVASVNSLKAEIDMMKTAGQATQVAELVDGAIAAGKIVPADRDTFVLAATADFAKVKATLDAKAANSALPKTFTIDGEGKDAPVDKKKSAIDHVKALREGAKK